MEPAQKTREPAARLFVKLYADVFPLGDNVHDFHTLMNCTTKWQDVAESLRRVCQSSDFGQRMVGSAVQELVSLCIQPHR